MKIPLNLKKCFGKTLQILFKTFYGNPFEEEAGLVHFTSKILMSHQTKDSVKNAHFHWQ